MKPLAILNMLKPCGIAISSRTTMITPTTCLKGLEGHTICGNQRTSNIHTLSTELPTAVKPYRFPVEPLIFKLIIFLNFAGDKRIGKCNNQFSFLINRLISLVTSLLRKLICLVNNRFLTMYSIFNEIIYNVVVTIRSKGIRNSIIAS